MTTDLHSLAAAYALDALDATEQAEFEAHLATCDQCTRDIAEFGAVAGSLADAASTPPPPHLRSDVLAQLGQVEQDRPAEAPRAPVASLTERRQRKLSMVSLLTAAAAVVLLAVGAVVLSGNRSPDFEAVVSASDAVTTQLDGASGTIEVVYSDDLDRVAVRGSGLDTLDPGLRYALWAIADGTPVPAGLFEPGNGSIEYVTELTDVTAQAWGVTVEPETGSDQPTSEIIYFAEV